MPQLPLFDAPSGPQHLDLPDGALTFWPQWLQVEEAENLKQVLIEEIDWQQREIQLFGRKVKEPRLTAWHGDSGTAYTYSGITLKPLPWGKRLAELKQQVEATTGTRFNSVLLNLYRHGQDSMGWHSDDEPELGRNPVIASLSLGETRPFHLRHRFDASLEKVKLSLGSGSLLLMAGPTQHYWQHQVPKTQRPIGSRLNLTFRWIGERGEGEMG